MPSSPARAFVKCGTCGKKFTRTEHLNRHLRSHTRERPFGCSVCGKRFSRTDILHRHEAAHRPEGAEKALLATTGAFRACLKCAAARVKCSGERPCQRCSARSIICHYPPRKKQGTSAGDDFGQADTITVEVTTQLHISEREDLNGQLPSAIHQGPLAQNTTNFTPSHFTRSRGVEELPTTTPSYELPQSTATNSAIQSPTGNSHSQYHNIYDDDSFLLYHPEVQFSNRDLSSVNWLPLSDPWDFTTPALYRPGSTNGDNTLPSFGDLQQSNALSGNMNNFAYGEISYDTTNRGSTLNHTSPRGTEPISIHSESHSSSNGNRDDRSGYYVDGDGGRATTSARIRRNRSISKEVPSQHNVLSHANQAISTSPKVGQEGGAVQDFISTEIYAEIRNSTCTIQFSIPSRNDLNSYVQLYFDKFHFLFPLLKQSHFGLHREEWIVVVAAAAVGAAYGGTLESRQCSDKLHEFLHKTLEVLENASDSGDQMLRDDLFQGRNWEQSIVALQARILNVIGMLHSGNQRLVKFAYSGRSVLTTACYSMDLLHPADHIYTIDHVGGEEKRGEWLTEQIRIRTGYFIWMVDCMVAYESDFRPQMKLIDAKAPLPCSDVAWESRDLKVLISDLKNKPPALCTAVEALYMEKKILPNVGELGRILIIHAMYHRTWDVFNYHRERLSSWTPTANIESIENIPSDAEIWLPSFPEVSRWRNIACDALDILHWSANGAVQEAAGLEHPIILHLHVARLILLTPVIQIRRLVSSMLERSNEQSRTPHYTALDRRKESEARHQILRWVSQDQYKARLSIIHAGAIFWNTRRYSYNSPLEPFAIYLATLVTWAYGKFTRLSLKRREFLENGGVLEVTIPEEPQNSDTRTPIPNHIGSPCEQNPAAQVLRCSPSPEPSFLHLDRPCDDDLVQIFVRLGHKMTGNMVRIGDVCGRHAAGKSLREGARILSGGDQGVNTDDQRVVDNHEIFVDRKVTWGLAEQFRGVLEKLATVVEEQEQD